MANRKALKQRKKRQLKRAFKTASKVVTVKEVNQYPEWILPAPINTEAKHIERTKAFQSRLDTIYGGTIIALNHYVNDRCNMSFKCTECELVFFGKAGHIVGKSHQRHECNMPLGDRYGTRLSHVSSTKGNRKSKNPKLTEKKFQELVWADLTPEQIAQELQINPNIIKDYFVEEGLIEVVPTPKKEELTYLDSSKFGRKAYTDIKDRLFLDCTGCNSIKYIEDYASNKKGFHGKASNCKECDSKRAKG